MWTKHIKIIKIYTAKETTTEEEAAKETAALPTEEAPTEAGYGDGYAVYGDEYACGQDLVMQQELDACAAFLMYFVFFFSRFNCILFLFFQV